MENATNILLLLFSLDLISSKDYHVSIYLILSHVELSEFKKNLLSEYRHQVHILFCRSSVSEEQKNLVWKHFPLQLIYFFDFSQAPSYELDHKGRLHASEIWNKNYPLLNEDCLWYSLIQIWLFHHYLLIFSDLFRDYSVLCIRMMISTIIYFQCLWRN